MRGSGSDDKSHDDKLKSYDGKDYSEVIDFPVELVDRDGVVRRYSYEESLAVYHRRIQSAPWRYSDDDLIRAEIGHCSARMDQIRKSYAHKAAVGVPVTAVNPRASLGAGYDLIRQFYRRALRERALAVDGDLPMKLALLDDQPGCRTYHVGFPGGRSEHLLYVYPMDRPGDTDPSEHFSAARDRFRGQAVGAGVESLLLAEETPEAGYILTGSAELPSALQDLARDVRPVAPGASDGEPGAPPSVVDWIFDAAAQPWWNQGQSEGDEGSRTEFELGIEALRDERAEDALEHLRAAVEGNPWHREAYLALLAVLDGAGLHAEAELYGAMAGHYLDDDGLVRYRQGINLVRQGRLQEAVSCFDQAALMDSSLYQPAYFAAHVLVAKGRDLDGAIERMTVAARLAPEPVGLVGLLRSLRRARSLRRGIQGAGVVVALGAAWAVSQGAGWAWSLLPIGLATLLLARPLTAALARVLVRRHVVRQPDVVPEDE